MSVEKVLLRGVIAIWSEIGPIFGPQTDEKS